MSAYRKGGHSAVYYLTVVDAAGAKHRVSTGTHDKATADDMELMLRTLTRRGSRDWDLVRPLLEKDPRKPHRRRLALARLYDHWRAGTLDTLRAELADVDLAASVPAWLAWLARNKRERTIVQYERNVRKLAPVAADGTGAPLWRSAVTSPWLAAQRDAAPGGVSSQLAHLTAWSSFFGFCVERGLLERNPLTDGTVKWPSDPDRNAKAKSRHIARLADVQRFVAAFPALESRAIAALRESTGADWDGLQPMRRTDVVDPARRLVYLPGDKTSNRPREVEVERWAWAHVKAYLDATPALPNAPMFTMPYETYKWQHNATRDALIAAGVAIPAKYSPHNARHSFAVRKRRAGWNDWKIAAYLGNTAQEVARTYGAFQPTRDDLAHEEANG